MKKFLFAFVFILFCGVNYVCRAEYLEDVASWYVSQNDMVYQSLQDEIRRRGVEFSDIDFSTFNDYNGFRLKEEEYAGDDNICTFDVRFSCKVRGQSTKNEIAEHFGFSSQGESRRALCTAKGFMRYKDNKIDWYYISFGSGGGALYPTLPGENGSGFTINKQREYVDILQKYVAYLAATYPIRSQYGRNALKSGYHYLFSDYKKGYYR